MSTSTAMDSSTLSSRQEHDNATALVGETGQEGPSETVRITVVIMLSIFSVVGVIGNAIAFYIFFRRRTTSTSVIFILALAGTDFFTCLVTIPYTVVFELLRYNLVYDLACKTYMFLITSTQPFSAYIMVGIALDRYFCICHPFLYAFTIPRAKAVIFCMGIPAFTFGVITALTYGTYVEGELEVQSGDLNLTLAMEEYGFGQHSTPDESDIDHFLAVNNLSHVPRRVPLLHYKMCVSNEFILSNEFLEVYQKIHALNFLLAYVSVAVLYILIYKSIFTRRANKARRKKNNLYPTSGHKLKEQAPEETQMTVISTADHSQSPRLMNNQTRKDAKCARKITLTARNDAGAFNKTGTKTLAGIPAGSEALEEEKRNLLTGGEATVAQDVAESGNNKVSGVNSNSTSGVSKSTVEFDDRESCVYIGPPPPPSKKVVLLQNLKTSDEESKDNGVGIMRNENAKELNNDISKVTEEDARNSTEKTKEATVEDGTTSVACPDDTTPEEKPLLPQSPPPQSPAVPPTSLSLKPNCPSQKSPLDESRDSAANKKHVQKDTQANSLKRKRPSTVRDRNLMANIKTAFMLFIVTLVFLIAFLPALLMANQLIPLNLIVFYGYFIYNVANPFIYAFMNQTFREDLKKMIGVCHR